MAFESGSAEPMAAGGAQVRDACGVDRSTALDILEAYLRDTLAEPEARLTALRLEGGRWQGRVDGSRQGVATVFLNQHGGKVVAGHTSAEGAVTHPAMEEAAYRHEVRPEADAAELDAGQTVPYPQDAERAEQEAGALPSLHFQTLKWYQPTRHRSGPATHEHEEEA